MPPLGAATLPGMAINVVGSIHNRSFTSVGKMLQFALSSIIVEAVLVARLLTSALPRLRPV
jgi:hypothetical protein